MSPDSDTGGAFSVPLKVGALLSGFGRPWWVAGGWAIDLFLGRVTRPHKDIEIALIRCDQVALQAYLSQWRFNKVAGGQRRPWARGERLTLPVHEIHGRGYGGQKLEVLLNEYCDGHWLFRRDSRITRPVGLLTARTAGGVPFLRPEIVPAVQEQAARGQRSGRLPPRRAAATGTQPSVASRRTPAASPWSPLAGRLMTWRPCPAHTARGYSAVTPQRVATSRARARKSR